jgi:hypothetical protein
MEKLRAGKITGRHSIARFIKELLFQICAAATSIGWHLMLETVIEVIAWTRVKCAIEIGIRKAVHASTRSKSSGTISIIAIERGVDSEDTRVKGLLRRALMAREYRKCVHAISDEKSESRLRAQYFQKDCAELAQIPINEQPKVLTQETHFAVAEQLLRKASRAIDEESLLRLLQRSSLPRIRQGKGVTGLARHWKQIRPDERLIFMGKASSKLGLLS